MVRFRIGRLKVGISIWFAGFVAIILMVSDNGIMLCGLSAMLIHEIGHLMVMTLAGSRARAIYLLMGRLLIQPARRPATHAQEAAILSGGIAANILCALFFLCAGNVTASLSNVLIAVYNLLPAGNLDGGALFLAFLNRRMMPKKAYVTHLAISFAVAFVMMTAGLFMLLRGYKNATLVFSGIYLTAQNLKNLQYTN